eukprot:670436-Pelagomonas_calceolata.AAC.5
MISAWHSCSHSALLSRLKSFPLSTWLGAQGTGVTVQAMAFGNMGATSGTGASISSPFTTITCSTGVSILSPSSVSYHHYCKRHRCAIEAAFLLLA